MARKKSKEELNLDNVELDENGEPVESKGSKLTSFLVGLVVVIIWLVIFALLIKMDVGGVGTMLRPYLKNVPVINQILPDASSEEIADETGYKFNSIAEAVERIKELESQLSAYQNSGDASAQQIADLQAEVDRLKVFEENQEYYEQLKDEFDREVVFTDNAPDISEYKKWYESIDADNAAALYAEVVRQLEHKQEVQDWAAAYAKMDAKNAAAILQEMTGDTNLVAEILECMTAKQRAAIEYKFNTELKPTPKMNDDGTVDFHTLENVNHIRKGEVVAVLHPEDRGTPGEDLLGRKVMPKKVKHVIFRHGRDLTVSEDGLQLISSVSGHVTLENDKVFVSNVLEIVDVDNSTGDIDYQGNVNIKGNVLAGFSVKATGDIAVSGIVEGATIVAGGNITFNRGVQGMNRAVIKAGGNIVTKFLESVEQVEAGGSIETDSILHSKVNAKGSIKAAGKKGLIIGGEVRSMTLVEAKVIGNELGTATVIGVGVDPAAKRRLDELQKSLQTMGTNKIQLNQIITALRKKQDLEGELSQDKKEMLQKTMKNMLIIDKELAEQKKEFEDLQSVVSEDSNARIKVYGTAYAGTKLIFGDQFMFIKEKYDHCQFIKERADIKSALL